MFPLSFDEKFCRIEVGTRQETPLTNAAKKSSEVFDHDRSSDVARLSNRVFGRPPKRVAFPGGTSRSAFIADMGDETFVFAKRENVSDSQLEGIVLRTIGDTGYVPKLKAVIEDWVVQEYVAGTRLPVLLNDSQDMNQREELVGSSLESLIHIHDAAYSANLQHRVPKVGTVDKWLWDRSGAAKRISNSIGISYPKLDREELVRLMDVKRNEFVKWDARPGNAMVNDNRVIWFDWEDCGRSNALDDLGFVLCDEWTCLDQASESRLLDKYFPFFNRSLSKQNGEHYLRVFGVIHMVLRMRMALKLRSRENKWWDREYCLQGDKVGVTQQEFDRLVVRSKRWADGVHELKPFLPWLDELSERY